MALIKWKGWRELDNQLRPKVNVCPRCGEAQHSPEELQEKAKISIFGPRGIIGLGIVLFIGMSAINSFDLWGGFEQIMKANVEKFFGQTTVHSAPKTLKRYTHSRVNIRKGPGTDFKIVSQLQAGELVKIRESKSKWVEVYKNGKGLGFVYPPLFESFPKPSLNERQRLLNTTSWGDFRKARKFKLAKPRKALFAIWEPILSYARNTLYPRTGTWAKSPDVFIQKLYGHKKLRVQYDELWVWEDDSSFTEEEKEHYKGQLDVFRMYWLKGKVQAHIVGKFYESNPTSGIKLSLPIHKIWKISDRTLIFKELKKSDVRT